MSHVTCHPRMLRFGQLHYTKTIGACKVAFGENINEVLLVADPKKLKLVSGWLVHL